MELNLCSSNHEFASNGDGLKDVVLVDQTYLDFNSKHQPSAKKLNENARYLSCIPPATPHWVDNFSDWVCNIFIILNYFIRLM